MRDNSEVGCENRRIVTAAHLVDKFRNFVTGPVAQWITRLTLGQEIPGSNPGRASVFCIFYFNNPHVLFFRIILPRKYVKSNIPGRNWDQIFNIEYSLMAG